MDIYTEPHIRTSALITIDTQNDFTLDHAPAQIAGTRDVVGNMVRLLKIFRKEGLPIIHVVRLYFADGSNAERCRRQAIESGNPVAVPGSDGAELVSDLKPELTLRLKTEQLLAGELQQIGENEFIIYKPRWGAFYRTRLEEFLLQKQCDTLIFSGCNFPNCPRTSLYEASERDFRTAIVTDALSQLYPKGLEEMQNIGVSLLTTAEIEHLLA